MNWNNIKFYKSSKNELDPSLEEILEKDHLLVKITDNSLYDTFEKEDLIRVKVQDHVEPEAFILFFYDGHLNLKKINEDEDYYIVSQMNPADEEKINKDEVTIIGPATGILRV